jgi:hypothetical protein
MYLCSSHIIFILVCHFQSIPCFHEVFDSQFGLLELFVAHACEVETLDGAVIEEWLVEEFSLDFECLIAQLNSFVELLHVAVDGSLDCELMGEDVVGYAITVYFFDEGDGFSAVGECILKISHPNIYL